MSDENKRTISQDDHLKLVGLLTLAREHNRALKSIERAAAGLLGEKDEESSGYFGHVSDAVYSDYDAAGLLRRLEIEVAP